MLVCCHRKRSRKEGLQELVLILQLLKNCVGSFQVGVPDHGVCILAVAPAPGLDKDRLLLHDPLDGLYLLQELRPALASQRLTYTQLSRTIASRATHRVRNLYKHYTAKVKVVGCDVRSGAWMMWQHAHIFVRSAASAGFSTALPSSRGRYLRSSSFSSSSSI